jgi:hypothetical protein
MDIFFTDPDDIPLPPEEVRIREFSARPWPDGRRVRLYLEVTPFQKRPNGEIVVRDPQDNEVASLSIIETIDPKMELTIHLRPSRAAGQYRATARLFYLEASQEQEQTQALQPPDPEKRQVVDESEITFQIDPQ